MALCATRVHDTVSVLRGNAITLRITLKTDGTPITDMATAIAARFVAVDSSGNFVIDKALGDMSVDDPETGTVSIPLSSTDTDLTPGRYEIAIQFSWSGSNVLEWNLTQVLVVHKDVIP